MRYIRELAIVFLIHVFDYTLSGKLRAWTVRKVVDYYCTLPKCRVNTTGFSRLTFDYLYREYSDVVAIVCEAKCVYWRKFEREGLGLNRYDYDKVGNYEYPKK